MTRNTKGKVYILMSLFIIAMALVLPFLVTAQDSSIDIQKYSTSYDFSAGALTADPNICSCSSIIDQIIVSNTGSFGAIFTVETNIPEFAQVPINTFQLEPGQNKVVDILITAECGVETIQDYKVYIKSNLNREQVINRQLSIQKCQSINAVLSTEKETSLPCEPVDYHIEITNPSSFPETYYIKPTTYAEYFDNQLFELNLPKGATGVVDTTFQMSCSDYGNKSISFNILSAKNELYADLNHNLEIKQAYNFSTDIPEYMGSCEQELKEQLITINNDATVPNGYSVELIGAPEFISLDSKYLFLEPGNSGSFTLRTLAGDKTSKEYWFTIKITTDIGDTVLEKNVSMNVADCYKLSVTIEGNENPDVCSGVNAYNAVIKNNGIFEETILLSAESKDSDLTGVLTHISEDEIDLKPGEEKNISLEVSSPDTLDNQKIPVLLSAKLDRDYIGVWGDSITLTTHNQYACTKPIVERNKIYARYSADEAWIGITNKGLVYAEYDAELLGTQRLELNEDKITLAPGETEYFPLKMDLTNPEPNEEYFNISLESDNGVVYNIPVKLKLTSTPWFEIVYEYSATSLCKTITTILAIVLIVVLILFIVKILGRRKTWQKQASFKWVLLVIAIIAMAVVFIYFGLPKSTLPPLNSDDPLTFMWYEDTSYSLDLSRFFSDPDGDTLIYELTSEPNNIDYVFDGSVVTFTPEPDWFGNRRIRFKATDESGASITSPRLTLEVVDVEETDIIKFHTTYCPYINLALFLLILIFLIATPWKKLPKEEDVKVKKTAVVKEKGYFYYVDKDGDVARRKVEKKTTQKKTTKKKASKKR